MTITELLSGLQPWDKTAYQNMGLSTEYIDMVNDSNSDYRDYILSKLNLNSSVNLHGGGIKIEFGDINNKLPLDKITSIIEAYGEEYIVNQIGGGLIDWIMGLFGKRNFDAFKARYDKLRDELDNKIVQFEVESRGIKSDTETNAKSMKDLLLNKKKIAMMEIMIDNQTNMKPERKKYILNLIALAKEKEQHLLAAINEFTKIVDEKNKAYRPYFFGLIGKKESFFDKLSADYQKTAKEFNEIYKHFSELTKQTFEIKSLKAKYGSLTPDIKAKLTKNQVKEFEHWEKNRANYEKIEAFTENHMEEANKLVQKQAELNMLIHDYQIAFGTLGKQRRTAEDILTEWDTKIRSVYTKIVQCVELGMKYRGILEGAKQLIVNNSNLITSLSTPIVEPAIKEYETHLTSVDYTSNLMEKLVGTLGEIKNNFINLVPSQNLQADILYVGATRSYLLTLIENIKRRQMNFSGGEKYLRDIVKGKVGGGSQAGGVYLEQSGFDTYPLYFLHTDHNVIVHTLPYDPANPATFSQYAKTGVPMVNLRATGATKNIIDEPYGIVLYDTPNAPGKTDIAGEYDKLIKATDKTDTMILPIIDFENDVIKIYEIAYNDISDLTNMDISVDHVKDINITHRNKKEFISYKGRNGLTYIIYNIYTDDADDINLKGKGKQKYYEPLFLLNSKCAILPVFSKIRTRTELIAYDEYHLLNPLTGLPILAVATTDPKNKANKEIILNFQTRDDGDAMDTYMSAAGNKGNVKYYHFNAVGIEYKIDDKLLDIDYGSGPTQFKMGNAKLADLPDVVDYHWGVMYQLTSIINNIFMVCLSERTTVDAAKKTVDFDIKNTKFLNNAILQVGIGNINDDDQTKLQLNNMNMSTFITDFFGGDPRVSIYLIKRIINKELTLDNGTLVFDPTAKGTKKATSSPGTVFGVAVPKQDSLSPKQRQAFDQILRMLPKTSSYWTNQGKILGMIDEFFKPEYRDKFELELHAIQNLVYDIRGIEQGILKININIKNTDVLPNYSLITSEMEVKPNDLKLGEAGEVLTNAGKDLRSIVQHSNEFARKFAAELGVNESNIITLLEEDNFLISTFTPGSKVTFANWVRDPAHPDRMKILDYLGHVELANNFIEQLKKSTLYYNHIDTICNKITEDGGVDKYKSKDAYEFLRDFVKKSGKRDDKQKGQQPGAPGFEFTIKQGQPQQQQGKQKGKDDKNKQKGQKPNNKNKQKGKPGKPGPK